MTMKLLIVYGTTEGQTRKICRFLRDEALKAANKADISDASDHPRSPEGYDAVIIGASVHQGKYQASIENYVMHYAEKLNTKVSAFISVSLTAAIKEEESWKELETITSDFLQKTGWEPTEVEQVAGALRYTQYDFLKKFIMRMIAKRSGGDTDTTHDHEYTQWEQVENLMERIIKHVEQTKAQKPVS